MSTPVNTSSTDSQMHNNIMAAGSKDRPPMLGPGRYSQWRSRFLRYIDTKPNGEGLRKSILFGPYIPSTVLVQVVAATEGNPAIQQHTTIETVLNMTPKNKEHFLSEKEAIFLLLTGGIIERTRYEDQSVLGIWEVYFSYKIMSRITHVLYTDEELNKEQLASCYYASECSISSTTSTSMKDDSNVTPDSSNICNNDNQVDQNAAECVDERAALANLTLDTEENKTILKQLKKANASLTQEALGEATSCQDSCLIALQNKQNELEKYKPFNDRTVNSKREKYGQFSILKVKEEKDIDKMIEMGNQSIQTIHMLAPKCSTYNGRPTFANPRYLKKAQSEKPCLYEIPYDTSDLANRFAPNREETMTLANESRSKLNKDYVKPYDYTRQNSLYEIFKAPSLEYLYQLERAKEVRKTMWRKPFWVPTGKLFNSCTSKVESKPTYGSNVDIHHIHACKQTMGLSASMSFNGQKQQRIDLNADALYNEKQENLRVWLLKLLISKKTVLECSDLAPQRQMVSTENNTSSPTSHHNEKWYLLKITHQAPFLKVQMTFDHNSLSLVLYQMTYDHNRSELGIQDHSNEQSSSKLVPKVVP
ncbi:hypothetical protein Tco_0968118 [Tanacetum coccineum]